MSSKNLANCSSGGGTFIENQATAQTSANFFIQGVGSSVTAVIEGASGGGDITDFKDSGANTVAKISIDTQIHYLNHHCLSL